MSLIHCPECNHQISDKAKFCVNCGYPIEEDKPKSTTEELPEYLKIAISRGANPDMVYDLYFGRKERKALKERKLIEEKEEKVSEMDQFIRDFKAMNPLTWPSKLQKMLG
jgi:hypothetical protein